MISIETIGTWAGEVYKALESADTRSLGLKQLKKATKLKKDEIMATSVGSAERARLYSPRMTKI